MNDTGLEIISVQTFVYSFVPSSKTPSSQAVGTYVPVKLAPHFLKLLRKMLGAYDIIGEKLERLTKDSFHDIDSEEALHQEYTMTNARKL